MATTLERSGTMTGAETPTHGIFINGEWRQAAGGKTFEVRNPATGELIARCADAGRDETKQAIEAAHAACPAWSQVPAMQRAQLLTKAANLMNERNAELAKLLTLENGKPLEESKVEATVAAAFL